MKSITKSLVLLCVLVVSVTVATACNGPNCTASTGTTTTDLPTKDEVNSAIMTAKVANSGNFAENLFNSIKTNHSTWHTDLWTSGSQEVVSVYYSVSQGSYGTYYLDETGNQITPSTSLTLKEKYSGNGVGSTTSGTSTVTAGTCTGPNCSQNTGTNSSSVISCPTCGTGTVNNNTTGGITSITPAVTQTIPTTSTPTTTAVSQASTTTPSSSMITLSSNNSSSLTADQQAKLDAFMEYFNGTQPLTKDGIKEQAIKCFFNGV
jgi:hypothetical protein